MVKLRNTSGNDWDLAAHVRVELLVPRREQGGGDIQPLSIQAQLSSECQVIGDNKFWLFCCKDITCNICGAPSIFLPLAYRTFRLFYTVSRSLTALWNALRYEFAITLSSWIKVTWGWTDISLSSMTLTGPPAWIRPPKNICPVNLGFLSIDAILDGLLLKASFCLAGLGRRRCVRPGVSDVVLPDISVQPVGEVEEPAVFGH